MFGKLMVRRNYIAFFLFIGLLSHNAGHAQVISTEQSYAANSPAVAMVQTVFSANVYVNKVEMNQRRFNQLVDSVQRLDTTGTMFSAEEKLDIVVKALYNSPFRFFSATPQYFRQRHRILSSGTGFFITGDGYLITNAHIIDRDSSFIRRKFTLSTFQEVTEANIKALQESWAMVLNDEQRNLLNNAYSAIYSQVSSMILFDLQREIYVQFRTDDSDDKLKTKRLPARVIIKGTPMPGKDVALLKIDSVFQLPTLPLSRETSTRIGEQVLVYGYPEPVTSNTFLAKETNIEPTLTSGIVSAVKRSVGGWPVIQMDAVITHGSSGSPVCNNRGEVIGLATFGSLEQKTGSLASGFNFAIPVSIIRSFLDSAKVDTKMSQAALAFNRALSFFYSGYYTKALKRFSGVKKINEEYPQLSYYIEMSSKKMSTGEDRDTIQRRSIFRLVALGFIIGGLLIYSRWKWKANRNKTILN
ncbi:S1C family serine protease [Terrimonas pollutisoli]|uniref:S1C family serine protease n=1 Tax=Terrimonas pollutisoli TaxID=3034147 RepID=UPI0023EBFCC3|nr:trypsin-like peptidase domain-containing protein [Terrimonas sp. H1YJ31]